MRVEKIGNIDIRFDSKDEIYTIACHCATAIRCTAKTHWVNHYKGDTPEGFVEYVFSNEESPVIDFLNMVEGLVQWETVIILKYDLQDIWREFQKNKEVTTND